MKPPFTFLPTSSHWPPSSFDSQSKHLLHLSNAENKTRQFLLPLANCTSELSIQCHPHLIPCLSLPPSLQEDFPPTHAQPMVIYSSLRIHVFFLLFHRVAKIHLHPPYHPHSFSHLLAHRQLVAHVGRCLQEQWTHEANIPERSVVAAHRLLVVVLIPPVIVAHGNPSAVASFTSPSSTASSS